MRGPGDFFVPGRAIVADERATGVGVMALTHKCAFLFQL